MHNGTACKTPIKRFRVLSLFSYRGDKKNAKIRETASLSFERAATSRECAQRVGYLYLIGKKISFLRDEQRLLVRLYERVGDPTWVSRIPGYAHHDRTGSSALSLETVQRTLHEESTTSIVVERVRAHVKNCIPSIRDAKKKVYSIVYETSFCV